MSSLSPQAQVSLQAATRSGRQNALDLDITGILDNANIFESKRLIHVPLAYAQNQESCSHRIQRTCMADRFRLQHATHHGHHIMRSHAALFVDQ